jgi:Ca-activated chloride channel family protein
LISWANPLAFALLVPAMLVVLQPRLTGVARLHAPGPDAYTTKMTVRLALAWLPRALQLLGLVLLVLAFARPQTSHDKTMIKSDGLDIMLAVDTSGSMRQEDFTVQGRPLDRLSVAKGVIEEFVEKRPYDRIGVVVFGEEAFTHVPLTLDHDTLRRVLTSVQIGVAGENRTAVGQAIAVAAKRLKELTAPEKVLVLLTDGQSNAGRFSPTEAAALAKDVGVRIYTIGVGSNQPRGGLLGMMRGGEGVDEATLTAVAESTGGRFFRATNTQSLRQIYETIDQLEPSPAEVEQIVQHTELYRWLLAPGLMLLMLQNLLSATWLRRSP